MTHGRVAPIELVEKSADIDLLREMLAFAADRMMDAEVETETGAAKGARTPPREKQPKLGALMGASREDVLASVDFPRERWPQIASTNPLERVNKEIKRRSDVVGIFPTDDAILRLVGAFAIVLEPTAHNGSLLETSDEWVVARRHMGLQSLARIADTPDHGLPAVAA
jgi:hypothetical protein